MLCWREWTAGGLVSEPISNADRIRRLIETYRQSALRCNAKAEACSLETETSRNSAQYYRAVALMAKEKVESLSKTLASIEGRRNESS